MAYNKATAVAPAVAQKVDGTPGARGRPEANREELETVTPGALAFSLQGRIGRLRYLAFSWPTVLLSVVLGLVAALTHPVNRMVLVVVVGVLWLWMPLRLMALRMHDLNQSAKWLLALMLLPGVGFALGKPQWGMLLSGLFWLVALLLIFLPGSESENDYGPPPGANTPWVTAGAVLFLALMAVGMIGNIKMVRSGKLHPALPGAAAPAWELPGSGNIGNPQDHRR